MNPAILEDQARNIKRMRNNKSLGVSRAFGHLPEIRKSD